MEDIFEIEIENKKVIDKPKKEKKEKKEKKAINPERLERLKLQLAKGRATMQAKRNKTKEPIEKNQENPVENKKVDEVVQNKKVDEVVESKVVEEVVEVKPIEIKATISKDTMELQEMRKELEKLKSQMNSRTVPVKDVVKPVLKEFTKPIIPSAPIDIPKRVAHNVFKKSIW